MKLHTWRTIDYRLLPAIGLVRYRRKKIQPAGMAFARVANNEEYQINLTRFIYEPAATGPVYYTALGMAVRNGRLLADYSVITPNIRETLWALRDYAKHNGDAPRLERGTLLGMYYPLTYGDWFRQGLLMLCSRPIAQPLVIPRRYLHERPYVRRDLARLGIQSYVPESNGVSIEQPTLLAPGGPNEHWLPGEIDRIREKFGIIPPVPRSGSIIYLSREGEQATIIHRAYPSRLVENIVLAAGGRVIRTAMTSLDEYMALAAEAETVIADHGAALCNLAWWRTKRVIELQSTLKIPFFITMASSAGVGEYFVIDTVDLADERLKASIVSKLNKPIRSSDVPVNMNFAESALV